MSCLFKVSMWPEGYNLWKPCQKLDIHEETASLPTCSNMSFFLACSQLDSLWNLRVEKVWTLCCLKYFPVCDDDPPWLYHGVHGLGRLDLYHCLILSHLRRTGQVKVKYSKGGHLWAVTMTTRPRDRWTGIVGTNAALNWVAMAT